MSAPACHCTGKKDRLHYLDKRLGRIASYVHRKKQGGTLTPEELAEVALRAELLEERNIFRAVEVLFCYVL